MVVGGYYINDYQWFRILYWWIFVLINGIILMDIGVYFIGGYWQLLIDIILMVIGGYCIGGYW